MAIENDAERTALLADFGVTATYTAEGAGAVSITVIYDEPYLGVDPDGAVVVESKNPTCLAKTTDVSAANHAATLVIASVTYNVVGVQHDGTGVTILELEQQ